MTSFYFIFSTKSTPPVGLEPTTARLRAARSTDWARKATDDTHSTCLFFQYSHDDSRLSYTHWHTTLHIYIHIHTHPSFYDLMTLYYFFCRRLLFPIFSFPPLYLFSPWLDFPFAYVLLPVCLCSSPCFLFLPFPLSSFRAFILLSLLLPLFLFDILSPLLLFRKLPWLSRQSDRLLTDRSLVRSQAEAPFFLFLLLPLSISLPSIFYKKVRLPWVSNPRPRG